MDYVFQFGAVWEHRSDLLDGAWLTLRLSSSAFIIGLALAFMLAYARETARPQSASRSAPTPN